MATKFKGSDIHNGFQYVGPTGELITVTEVQPFGNIALSARDGQMQWAKPKRCLVDDLNSGAVAPAQR